MHVNRRWLAGPALQHFDRFVELIVDRVLRFRLFFWLRRSAVLILARTYFIRNIGDHYVGRIVALFHRGPQLSGTRIEAQADGVAKAGRDHLMTRAEEQYGRAEEQRLKVAREPIPAR